jgi:hypothetical protein
MSQSIRQSELFAGNDWQVLYRAFTEVNFNASDPPSINRALRNYLQTNFPENFNDWIESSEFVALIDLLSWLAGTLAFKTDINARESFLETAEQRESILRLARFISYNPRRNQCAQGLLKIVEVSTDDDVYDGFGVNLNSSSIQWDNPDDPNWFERFILVMNSAFISTNQFGVPLKNGIVADAKTQLYRMNNVMAEANLSFKAKVSGSSMDFELVNGDFTDGEGFTEREPDFNNAFHLFYRNDGNGNSSPDTGFFFMFKQGTLQRTLFNIPTPVENNVLDLGAQNVNDTDVWVQTVTDTGTVLESWSKVPAIFSENITYNNYDPSIRNIFSVLTRDNDAISIRFSDGRFGAVPTGNIRVFYRTSNGLQYQIRPTDMNRVKLTIPYYNRAGVKKTLTVIFSLQESISNSTPRETDDQVKARAPAVYATQNRMVSGEDYNTFPLQSNLAVKLKAINRIYSGHSRYIDLNDPTGNYQDVNVFADDGIFYREPYTLYTEVPVALGSSPGDIVTLYIQPTLYRQEVRNYANDYLLKASNIIQANPGSPAGIVWHRANADQSFTATGYFSDTNTYLAEGATVEFISDGKATWATIANITGDPTAAPPAGAAGPVTLSMTIDDGAVIRRTIPRFTPGLDFATSAIIQSNIQDNQSFSLWFDYSIDPETGQSGWVVSPDTPTETMFQIMKVDYSAGGLWSIVANGLRYVFESQRNVQWYDDGRKTVNSETGAESMDYIRVLGVNEDLTGNGAALGQALDLAIDRIYINRDGSADPHRVTVSFVDDNLNGYPDDPETFYKIVDPHPTSQYLFWQNTDIGYRPLNGTVTVFETEELRRELGGDDFDVGAVSFQIGSNVAIRQNTFWVKTTANANVAVDTENGWTMQRAGAFMFGIGRGPNVAGEWVGAANPQEPGNPGGTSPDWQEWWQEILPPQWVTPAGSLVDTNETTFVYGTLLATDPQGLTVTYLANSAELPQGSATVANAVSNNISTSAGITIQPNGIFSGRMPDVVGEQIWSFDVVATNGILSSTRSFTMRALDTLDPPDFQSPLAGSLGSFLPGADVSVQFFAESGGRPLTYAISSGAIPQGLVLTQDGLLIGTMPDVDDSTDRVFTFTVRASNGQTFDDREFSLTLTQHPAPIWQVILVNSVTFPGEQVASIGYNPRLGTSLGPHLTLASSGGSLNNIYLSLIEGASALAAANITFSNGIQVGGGTGALYSPNVSGVVANTVINYTLRAAYGSLNGPVFTDQKFEIKIVS